MTMNDQENGIGAGGDTAALNPSSGSDRAKRRRNCKICMWCCLVMVLLLVLVVVILSLTVFKVKQPKIQLVSSTVEGVAPRVSFPAFKVELNITLNLTILVDNPNHVSFKAGKGESQLLYKDEQVGDAQLDPGMIPSEGSATLVLLLTIEADRFADSGLTSLVKDIMDGELPLEVKTRIPGRAKILFVKKHVVTTSDCQLVIGFPDMKVKSQDCKQHTKF